MKLRIVPLIILGGRGKQMGKYIYFVYIFMKLELINFTLILLISKEIEQWARLHRTNDKRHKLSGQKGKNAHMMCRKKSFFMIRLNFV
jgi:hypothetical protein